MCTSKSSSNISQLHITFVVNTRRGIAMLMWHPRHTTIYAYAPTSSLCALLSCCFCLCCVHSRDERLAWPHVSAPFDRCMQDNARPTWCAWRAWQTIASLTQRWAAHCENARRIGLVRKRAPGEEDWCRYVLRRTGARSRTCDATAFARSTRFRSSARSSLYDLVEVMLDWGERPWRSSLTDGWERLAVGPGLVLHCNTLASMIP